MKVIAFGLLLLAPLAAQEQSQRQPHDVASRAPKIYIVGSVKKPGVYEIRTGEQMSVMLALARAEGMLPSTAKKAFIYRRNAGNERSTVREEITLDLSKLLNRKLADVPLQAGDILYIPQKRSSSMRVPVPVKGTPPFQIPADWWQGS